MNSRPRSPSPQSPDRTEEELTKLIQNISQDREAIASEIDVLRSIYGQNAIRTWQGSDGNASVSYTLRYEVVTNLPSYEDIHIRILVSLPLSYPASSPPQLQLLSRYIGAFSVDRALFGDVLKTFISQKSGVEFTPDTVVVFDGIQHVIDICSTWYGERLSEEKAGNLIREEEKSQRVGSNANQHIVTTMVAEQVAPTSAIIPDGVEVVEAEPIVDRKSVFIGRACRITHPSQVTSILAYLMSDKRIARAAHPTINAWRCKIDGVMHQDNDDDGETAAGGRLAHLLQILDLDGILVIVTRFFGGIHLGPDRFKHINQAARSALEKGHFLDSEVKSKANARIKRN